VGWSMALGSAVTFAVPEKRLQLPALVSLLGMGAETPPSGAELVFSQSDSGDPGVMRPKDGDTMAKSEADV